jgi:hypothetical protein
MCGMVSWRGSTLNTSSSASSPSDLSSAVTFGASSAAVAPLAQLVVISNRPDMARFYHRQLQRAF